MALTSLNEYLIRQHIKARGELAEDLKLDPIVEEALSALTPALDAADSDASREASIKTYFDDRAARLFVSTHSAIPEDRARTAFGAERTGDGLEAQRLLEKDFGLAALTAEATRWNTKIGSRTPGRAPGEPDAATVKKIADKVRGEDDEGPSKNPWHDRWRAPGKTDAERQAARLAAQTAIIRSFGTKAAARMSAACGKQLSGAALRK